MKRIYADLHLCVDVEDSLQVVRVARKASEFGYGLVSVPFSLKATEQKVKQVREAFLEVGVDFASRVDLWSRSPGELLGDVRRLRRRFEVVAAVCVSKAVARQAAKDRRVDVLCFPQPDFRGGFFDVAEGELASGCLGSFEVDVKPLLFLGGAARARFMFMVGREVESARGFGVPVVVSSGVGEELLLRRPLELACLGSLVGLSGVSGVDAVSKNPVAIVSRNREKLGSGFVAPGIRVVRRGRDC
jgi:RNase P/RNase MRP subunit p30